MVRAYIDKYRQFSVNARIFFLATSIARFANGAFMAIYNIYLLGAGVPVSIIALLATVRLVAGSASSLPAGLVSDRLGYRRVIIASSFLVLFTQIGKVTTLSPGLLMGLALFEGAAMTSRQIAQAPFLAANSGNEERTHLFSSLAAASNFTNMIGSTVGGFLPALFIASLGLTGSIGVEVMTMRWTLLLASGVSALSVLPLFKLEDLQIEGTTAVGRRHLKTQLKQLASSGAVRALVITNALIGLGAGMVIPLFNVFLTEHLGATTPQVGTIMAVSSVTLTVATLLGPTLVENLGKVRTVAYCQLASLPFMIGMGFVPILPVVAVSSWLRSSSMNMANPVQDAFTMEIVPDESRATVSSLIRMGRSLARAFGVSLAGYMMEHISYQSPYMIAVFIYALSSIWFLLAFSGKHPRKAGYSSSATPQA